MEHTAPVPLVSLQVVLIAGDDEPLMEVGQVAKRLNASPGFVRWLIRRGKLKAIRLEGRWKIDRSDLKAFIDARRDQGQIRPGLDGFLPALLAGSTPLHEGCS